MFADESVLRVGSSALAFKLGKRTETAETEEVTARAVRNVKEDFMFSRRCRGVWARLWGSDRERGGEVEFEFEAWTGFYMIW